MLEQIKRYFSELSKKKLERRAKNIVLYGESGAGKSLFLLKLMRVMYSKKKFDDFNLVYYKLRDLSGMGTPQK